MNVPFTTGLGGRQGAQACSSDRADLGDDPSALVVVVLETASGAVGRRFESCRGHHPLQHPNLWLLIAGPTIRLSPNPKINGEQAGGSTRRSAAQPGPRGVDRCAGQ